MVLKESDKYQRPILVYDLDCGFCRWSVAKVLAWDRHDRLRVLALQDPGAAGLLAAIPPELRMRSSHLVMPDGTVYSGGDALAPMADLLPGGAPLRLLAHGTPWLVDRGYRWIAGNRMKVSKLVPASAKQRAEKVIEKRRAAGG